MNKFYSFLLISTLLISAETVFIVEAEKDAATENWTKWQLPEAAKARFGKGGINAIQFSPDGTQIALTKNSCFSKRIWQEFLVKEAVSVYGFTT